MQPAVFGEDVVGRDQVGVVLGQPPGAVGAAGLLVGDGEEDEVAAGPEARRGQMRHRHGHRRGEVQHVDRAATPDLAVDELAAEGVA